MVAYVRRLERHPEPVLDGGEDLHRLQRRPAQRGEPVMRPGGDAEHVGPDRGDRRLDVGPRPGAGVYSPASNRSRITARRSFPLVVRANAVVGTATTLTSSCPHASATRCRTRPITSADAGAWTNTTTRSPSGPDDPTTATDPRRTVDATSSRSAAWKVAPLTNTTSLARPVHTQPAVMEEPQVPGVDPVGERDAAVVAASGLRPSDLDRPDPLSTGDPDLAARHREADVHELDRVRPGPVNSTRPSASALRSSVSGVAVCVQRGHGDREVASARP